MRDSYDALMSAVDSHIEVHIDVRSPIELGDFVGAFTSIANQYEKFIKASYPDLDGEARVFVREMRSGSIIADLVPVVAHVISGMDSVIIVDQFVQRYGGRLLAYAKRGGRVEDATKGDLKDLLQGLQPIAHDASGRQTIRHVTYQDGQRKIKASVEFDTEQARRATREIEDHRKELDRFASADHERVLMYFKRSDIGGASVGKRSGERVIIEGISEKDLALIYASNLAEQRIKDEIRNSDDNPYKKGFVVDVNVQTKGGRPAAYAVTNVHQVIDLPDDED